MATIETPTQVKPERKRRGLWYRTMVQWHWVSSAICLAGMLLFSITGITLNHASEIEATPEVVHEITEVPSQLLVMLEGIEEQEKAPLPTEVADWLSDQFSIPVGGRLAEWSESEIYLSMPGPGSDAWLAIDRMSGEVEFEKTRRGWIAYLNDLHKGRNTGIAWKWFIDLFAVSSLIFCLTGLYLLWLHGKHRRMTWPVVALGLAIPVMLALLISHFPSS